MGIIADTILVKNAELAQSYIHQALIIFFSALDKEEKTDLEFLFLNILDRNIRVRLQHH